MQTGNGGDGEAPSLAAVVADERTPSPDARVMLEDDLNTIKLLLRAIDDREATILRLRYGLDGTEPLTLKEIGTHVNLTRERVRQIEIEALKKLNSKFNSDRPLAAIRARAHADAVRRSA